MIFKLLQVSHFVLSVRELFVLDPPHVLAPVKLFVFPRIPQRVELQGSQAPPSGPRCSFMEPQDACMHALRAKGASHPLFFSEERVLI
eukprot:2186472-Prorocentrum_lima.AAC.1